MKRIIYASQASYEMAPDELISLLEHSRANNEKVGLSGMLLYSSQSFLDWTRGFEHVEDEELAEELPGFTAAIEYPLVNPDLVSNAGVAQTLLKLYATNRVR